MRKILTLLSTLMLVSVLLAACAGEETSTALPGTTEAPTLETPAMTEEPVGTETLAPAEEGTPVGGIPVTGEEDPSRLSNELDLDVWNGNGDQIGEVNDMIVDLDNSRVSYVIVGTGGFLEIGEKDVLVPWDQLELQTAADNSTGDTNAFILQADQQMFESAPDVDVNTLLPPQGEPATDWDIDIRNYWQSGVIPGTPESLGTETADTTVAETPTAEAMGSETAIPSVDGTESVALQGVVLASDLLGTDITVGANGEVMDNQNQMAETATPESSGSTAVGTATPDMTTTDTTNQAQVTDATVDDVIINTDSGEIKFLVLDTAFADGERFIPVPLDRFQWDAVNGSYILDVDQPTLEGAPIFPDGQYPDTSVDGWDTEFLNYWH